MRRFGLPGGFTYGFAFLGILCILEKTGGMYVRLFLEMSILQLGVPDELRRCDGRPRRRGRFARQASCGVLPTMPQGAEDPRGSTAPACTAGCASRTTHSHPGRIPTRGREACDGSAHLFSVPQAVHSSTETNTAPGIHTATCAHTASGTPTASGTGADYRAGD